MLKIAHNWPGATAGPRFVLDVLTGYYSQPSVLAPGRYVFDVAVHASNARRRDIHLQLTFEPRSFRDIDRHGRLGDGIPGVQLIEVSGPPGVYDVLPTDIDIVRVQSDNFSRDVVLE